MRNQTRSELDRLSNSLIKRREVSGALAQAEDLVSHGDFSAAEETIERILRQDPESTEALHLKNRIAEKNRPRSPLRPLTPRETRTQPRFRLSPVEETIAIRET